jgi:hypothetical protein
MSLFSTRIMRTTICKDKAKLIKKAIRIVMNLAHKSSMLIIKYSRQLKKFVINRPMNL